MGDNEFLDSYDEATRETLQRLLEAEERSRRARVAHPSGSVEVAGESAAQGSRRRFLGGAAGALGATAVAMLPARAGAVPAHSTRVPGRPTGDGGGYGSRAPFERAARERFLTPNKISSWTMTPLAECEGIVTPSGLHFESHHGGIAEIDPARHRLIVHGMVERPKTYTLADLRRFPSVSRFLFIECAGNTFSEWREPLLKTVQGTHGLMSTSEWTGVPLATILNETGVRDGAAWILAEGADAAVMTRSIPLAKARGDAFLAYAQNGEAIRPEQGYPLRLILPGFEGNTQVKWLRRLEVSDQPFMTREETSRYTDLVQDGKARQFSFLMEAKSVITFPSGEMTLPGPGFYEIRGLAWSGQGVVRRVDVSVDGGTTWQPAALQEPILPMCHTRFRFPWRWDGRPAVLQSRCEDETGYVQPTIAQLVAARGVDGGPFGSVYHLNGIQSWAVAGDGSVKNVHHD